MGVSGLEIVQVVRAMHPYGGAGGVACALDAAFRRAGVATRAVTLAALRPPPRDVSCIEAAAEGPVRRAVEVAEFTWRASRTLRRHAAGEVRLVHGDALGGDIYVDHGLHRALLRQRPWLAARNPLHAAIWAREAWRHAHPAHRAVVCLTAEGAAAMAKAYPRAAAVRRVVLPNGVDRTRFFPAAAWAPLLPGAPVTLVFVGHAFGRKGLNVALGALARLPQRFRLDVVGGDDPAPYRRLARRLGVDERTAFLGARRDVADILRDSRLLLLPSRFEAWPLVALEAMACGTPCVLADFPSAAEVVGVGPGDAETAGPGPGRLVALTPEALADAILDCIADPEVYAAMRQAALARAARFDWDVVAAGYIALARDVLADRPASRVAA